jgi:hypothetical protein
VYMGAFRAVIGYSRARSHGGRDPGSPPGRVAYGRKAGEPPDELKSERRLYAQLTGRVASQELADAGAEADTVCAEIATIVGRELAARRHRARARS